MGTLNFKVIFTFTFTLILWSQSVQSCPEAGSIGQPCDEASKGCPAGFSCTDGKCGCPSNAIFSEKKCHCATKAGSTGCMSTEDCIEGSYCYHPRFKSFKNRKPAFCKCCAGAPEEGVGGLCPGATCISGSNWR